MNTATHKRGSLPSYFYKRGTHKSQSSKRRERPSTKVKALWQSAGSPGSLKTWAKESHHTEAKEWLARK